MDAIVSSNFSRHTPRDVQDYKVEVEPFSYKQLIPQKIVIEIAVSPNDFVDGNRSFFSFFFKSNRDGDTDYSFGKGSAINVIKSIQCYGSDGQLVDDVTGVNVFKSSTDRWLKKTDFFSSGRANTSGYSRDDLSDSYYTIELSEIIPLFSAPCLLPSNIIDGMRIEIELAPVHETIFTTATSGLDGVYYEIEDPRIQMNVKKMDHEFITEYAKKQQVISFDTYKHQEKYFNKERVNIPLQYALANAKYVFTTVIKATTNPQDVQLAEFDRLKTDYAGAYIWAGSEFRYRVGNLTIPERPAQRLAGWELANSLFEDANYVSLRDFTIDSGIMVCDLNRGTFGTPVYNNNEVTLEYTDDVTSNIPKIANMFCVFEKRLVLQAVSEEEKQAGYTNKLSIME